MSKYELGDKVYLRKYALEMNDGLEGYLDFRDISVEEPFRVSSISSERNVRYPDGVQTTVGLTHENGANFKVRVGQIVKAETPIQLVTVKLPKNPEHNPKAKVTGKCVDGCGWCTDSTGEHHTIAVVTDSEVDKLREKYGHITRVERVKLLVPYSERVGK